MEHRRSVLGEFIAWEAFGSRLGTSGGVVHGSIDVEYGPPLERNLPKISFACSIPFNTVFVGWLEKSGGGSSSGGIQFAKDVEMLSLVPQLTTRLSLLGVDVRMEGR